MFGLTPSRNLNPQELLRSTDGPTDAAWGCELELMIQEGRLLEALVRSDELRKELATGRGAGGSAPQVGAIEFDLYKMLFCFWALVNESILLFAHPLFV